MVRLRMRSWLYLIVRIFGLEIARFGFYISRKNERFVFVITAFPVTTMRRFVLRQRRCKRSDYF